MFLQTSEDVVGGENRRNQESETSCVELSHLPWRAIC
jgi:hypothetical protein